MYNAGPLYSVNSATTSTSATIIITVTSTQAFLQYNTLSKSVMTSGFYGTSTGTSGGAPITAVSPPISATIPIAVAPPISAPITVVSPPISVPIAASPPMSAPIDVAAPVTSAPAPGSKKVDLISNDWGT